MNGSQHSSYYQSLSLLLCLKCEQGGAHTQSPKGSWPQSGIDEEQTSRRVIRVMVAGALATLEESPVHFQPLRILRGSV
ncbi:hypothetical protein EVAR_86722_1 [Eumeta japonica]|uniref:Uncharacterized protein n=1 Tax=Eumeta variegata TaxID=151549 RepID=A0A4C1ZGD0_EUMVA|nr:hypothetical protein EVAR_86722_1 [Eumeta japonica]